MLFWPAAYVAIYVPLIVPNEAWQAGRVCFWSLTCAYAVVLCAMGIGSRLVEVLLASAAITISLTLFIRLAAAAHLPAFLKGPDDLLEAFMFAAKPGLLAGTVMLGAKGVWDVLRSRARRSAA